MNSSPSLPPNPPGSPVTYREGLGLSLSYDIAKAQGETLVVISIVERGLSAEKAGAELIIQLLTPKKLIACEKLLNLTTFRS